MPVYTYRREDGTTFDIRQSFQDNPLTHDPETGQRVVRLIHNTGVIFKGSGFYVNDSKSGSKSSSASSSASSAGSSKDQNGNSASDAKDAKSSSDGDSGTKSETKTSTPSEKSRPAATTPATS
jgi:predicted nucleic acid-binding Zn ribbon protein